MYNYPKSIQNLIDLFSRLPGIGPKTAERLIMHLLDCPDKYINDFSLALKQLKGFVSRCQICFNYSETKPCLICGNKNRDQKIICVVAKPQDVIALEKTSEFNGVYHVLGGNLNPIEGINIDNLKIDELLKRIKTDSIKEIILALNPDIDGETTSLTLIKLIKPLGTRITRLARGLPMGSDLEYADEITLCNALKGRREV